jgi:GNAT superfamily N-acetyltransferase
VSGVDIVSEVGDVEETEVVIRRLGPGDGRLLVELARDAPDFDLAGRTPQQTPLAPSETDAYLNDASVLHWVAQDATGKVLGDLLCYVEPRPSAPARQLLLYEIGVRSRYRRQGVGRKLVEAMRQWMQTERVSEVWVLADNPDAEKFYLALGFEREEDQGIHMSLSLDESAAAPL